MAFKNFRLRLLLFAPRLFYNRRVLNAHVSVWPPFIITQSALAARRIPNLAVAAGNSCQLPNDVQSKSARARRGLQGKPDYYYLPWIETKQIAQNKTRFSKNWKVKTKSQGQGLLVKTARKI